MVKITKKERDYLVNECNVNCGEDGVSRTLKNKYYLCESKRNLGLLNEFRKRHIIYSGIKTK